MHNTILFFFKLGFWLLVAITVLAVYAQAGGTL